MIEPSIDELLKKVDSKYSLVVVAAKRAREVMSREEDERQKPVSNALKELAVGDIRYYRVRSGVK